MTHRFRLLACFGLLALSLMASPAIRAEDTATETPAATPSAPQAPHHQSAMKPAVKALHDKMKADHEKMEAMRAQMDADRAKMKAAREEMKADHEKMQALHKEHHEEKMQRRAERREHRGAPNGQSTPASTGTETPPAAE